MNIDVDLQDRMIRVAAEEEGCPHCEGRGRKLGAPSPVHSTCDNCKGTGKVARYPDLRVTCTCNCHTPRYTDMGSGGGGWKHREHAPCRCQGHGWTVSDDFVTWYKAAHADGNHIFILRADGPGYRVDVRPNHNMESEILATGWSDGFRGEPYDPFVDAPYEPDPLEALVAAFEQVEGK